MVRIMIMRVREPYLIGEGHGEDRDHEGTLDRGAVEGRQKNY